MSKTVVQVLEEVEELLSDRKHWTQGALARDAKGGNVSPSEPQACQWCLFGAIVRATAPPSNWPETTRDLELREKVGCLFGGLLAGVEGSGSYVDYNDSHDHPYVMRLIARAKEVAKAQETGDHSSQVMRAVGDSLRPGRG